MSESCAECNGDGYCNGCRGYGRVLASFANRLCPVCLGYGQIKQDDRRTWCRECGGSGRLLNSFPVFKECQDCIGDGACTICQGTGVVTDT